MPRTPDNEINRVRLGGGGPYIDADTMIEIRKRSKDLNISHGKVIDLALKQSEERHAQFLKELKY